MPNRFEQLDSLRGLAALSVVVCHCSNLVPGIYQNSQEYWWLTSTPLNALRAGGSAVIFFFVLSGFVLALPFFKSKVPYRSFAIRRIARIWFPYVVATAAAIAMALAFYPEPVEEFGKWSNHERTWPSVSETLQHFTLVSSFQNNAYNPVVWSLVQEMRISLIFPLLVWVVRRFPWPYVVPGAFALSWLGAGLGSLLRHFGHESDYPITLHYVSLFLIGILLAKHINRITERCAKLPAWAWWLGGTLALLCYTHGDWIKPSPRLLSVAPGHDWLVMTGVVTFMVFGLTPSRFSSVLSTKPLVFLGKISYSLYLYHAILLLSISHALHGVLPVWGIWSLVVPCSLLVATLGYFAIEKPSIWLGYQLASRASPGVSIPANRVATVKVS